MIKINGAVENYVSEQDYFIVETFFKNQLKSKKYATIIHSNISYRLDNNMLDTLDVVSITITVGIIYIIYKII